MVVDVGGATTDVHSATRSAEPSPGIRGPLLPMLPVLRTVQGDLGIRSNAPSVVTTDGAWLTEALDLDEDMLRKLGARRAAEPGFVARDQDDWAADEGLATSCVFHALRRHCGRLSINSRPNQPALISADGPDLRSTPMLIGTGGVLVRSAAGASILHNALERCDDRTLTPRAPTYLIDSEYILAATGLLAQIDPGAALRLIQDAVLGSAST
jgi:uncharacterized protein (TIGR01319 family)